MIESRRTYGCEVILCNPGVPMMFQNVQRHCGVLHLTESVLVDYVTVIGVRKNAWSNPWLGSVICIGFGMHPGNHTPPTKTTRPWIRDIDV